MEEEVLTRKSRRRSVRIKRQSIGIPLLTSDDLTSTDPPLNSCQEDLATANSVNNDAWKTQDNLYGSIWMETCSPVVKQSRRRSRLHSDLAIVQLSSATVESERDQDRLSIEILRDINRDEIETGNCGMLDEFKLPVSLRELGVSPSSIKYGNSPSPNLELEKDKTLSNQSSAKGNSDSESKNTLSPLETKFPDSFSDGSMTDNSLYSNGSLSPCYDSLLPTMKYSESGQTLDNSHQDKISPIVGQPALSPDFTPYSPSQAVYNYMSQQTPNCHSEESVHLNLTTIPRLQIESPQRWEISPLKASNEAGGAFIKTGDKSTVVSRRKSVKKPSVRKNTILSPTSDKREVKGFLSICKVFAERLVSVVKQSPDAAQSQAESTESDNSKSPLKNLDKELERTLVDSTAVMMESNSMKRSPDETQSRPTENLCLQMEYEQEQSDGVVASTISERSKCEELRIEDRAEVFTHKIENHAEVNTSNMENQAEVYTSNIENQAEVYTSNIENQAEVYTSNTSGSGIEHKMSSVKITNCKLAVDGENEKYIENNCAENAESNESYLVSGSKHSSGSLLEQKDLSVCEKQPNHIITVYTSSVPCSNQITEVNDLKQNLVENQNIVIPITSKDVGEGSVKLDSLFEKEQEIDKLEDDLVKLEDDIVENSNGEKGLVGLVAGIDCLITDRKQSKQKDRPLRRRVRQRKSLDVTQIKSTSDIICSPDCDSIASICQQNSSAVTSPESNSAGALCVVTNRRENLMRSGRNMHSGVDALHISPQQSLSDFTAEVSSKVKRRGRKTRRSLGVSSLTVTAVQDLEKVKDMTKVNEEADVTDVNKETTAEYLGHQQREIQIKKSTGDSDNDGQEVGVDNVDCIEGKDSIDAHTNQEYFSRLTSDCDTSVIKRQKIKPLSEDVLRELDEYLGIKPCNTGTEISGKRHRKSLGKKGVSSRSCDTTTDDCANLTPFDESCLHKENNSNVVTGVPDILNKAKTRRGRSRKCYEPPQAIEEESENIGQDCLEIESQKSVDVERAARRTTRLRRRSGELYKRSQTKNLAEESSSPSSAGDQDCCGEVLMSRVESVQSASNLHKKRKQKKGEDNLEDIYRNKNFQRPTEKTWETIYEDPLSNDSSEQFFGKKRFRRVIDFSSLAPAKAKKRKQKARKVGMDPKQRKRQSLSHEVAADKIEKMTQELKEFECSL